MKDELNNKEKISKKKSLSAPKKEISTTSKKKIESNTLPDNKNQSKTNTELAKSTTIKKKNINIFSLHNHIFDRKIPLNLFFANIHSIFVPHFSFFEKNYKIQ